MNLKGNTRKSTREEKIAFLKAHRELWHAKQDIVKAALVRAGLVSPKTHPADLKLPYLLYRAQGRGHRQAIADWAADLKPLACAMEEIRGKQ